MIANYYLMITELSKIQLTQDDYGDKKKVEKLPAIARRRRCRASKKKCEKT